MKKSFVVFIFVLFSLNILFGQTNDEVKVPTSTNMKVATYLYFEYNAKDAIETYKSIFNATVVREHTFSQGMTKNEKLIGKIFHAELIIGDLNLYISDSGEKPALNSIKFVVEISDKDKAHQCFDALAQNGKIISEFKKMPWGPTIAKVIDKFGITWDIVIC